MDKNKGSSWAKHWDFMLLDILCLLLALWAAYWLRHGEWNLFHRSLYREVAFVLFFADILVAYFGESYRGILRRTPWEEAKSLLKHETIIFLIEFFYLFATQKGDLVSRTTIVGCYGIALILTYGERCLLKRSLKSRKHRLRSAQNLLMLTTRDRAERILRQLSGSAVGDVRLAGLVLADGSPADTEVEGVPVVSDVQNLPAYVQKSWVDSIFVSLPEQCPVDSHIIDNCILMGVTMHFDMKQFSSLGTYYVSKLAGENVLSTSIVSGSTRAMLLKRGMDVVGGLMGCLITGILFLFVAPCIYAKSPGPIFFKQERIGKNGRRFKMYKFRSMYLDAEERKKELMAQNEMKDGHMFKMEKDPRILPGIGTFIRKTSIDEFPQFFNVLKGDMSLVGTRPPTVDEWEQYEASHRTRMAIRPGLTGLWQVSGRSKIVDFDQVVELDKKYITEWNLGMDIQILWKTIGVVLRGDGSC